MTAPAPLPSSPRTRRRLLLGLALALALVAGACDADTSPTAADAQGADAQAADVQAADAPPADGSGGGATTGAVRVTGHYDGTLAGSPNLRVSMFPCPFQMPPKYFFEGTYDATSGDVEATQDQVDPGTWCLMAYIDVNPDDGLAPVPGLDPQNVGNGENANGAVSLTVTAGQTTEVALSFALAVAATQ